MLHIKRNDTVKILAGKDKGKTGKVLKVYPMKGRAIVQGANFTKKHVKQKRQDEPGGIIQREASIDVSNLAVVCKGCNRPVRVGVDVLRDGSRARYCKKCKEVL
ncbi:MAG: 50S ribosomal protein L24 [Candidatus Makaraimicrobium thalassicum]|nr:MAG: 50S ribosomal protein L24 [Candidatus Omnitrophota bacterium]